ncbi:MAG: response regulator [Hyphomonadaceae bacterium]|nr:response regulator [Hyphomonadaceae bacterium]
MTASAPVILVAEDEVLIRMAVADSLRDAGFAVTEAASAAEALKAVRAGLKPDVLVTDVAMPGTMDGLALATLLQRENPALSVIVTSAHIEGANAELRADFVPKPYDPRAVVQSVTRALQR